ncbi:DUF4440 domain-containing protein [Flagellimonas sp. CMM7]|uniref:YybH family protein n=1 Tax=Flagellimonas sp. CMM7 TaxID=2654676 RepID=UPI0013D1BBEA|nr:DUF4440 domain-containing protein [Flagellimonas sp. CMM7]UII81123.1 DUF4440 domain-containing protein [Flagellimonas sp. CMM7]
MQRKTILICFFTLSWVTHGQESTEGNLVYEELDSVQQVIHTLEKSFQKMTVTDGIANAFAHFSAPDSQLNRNNHLIKGKEQIFEFYDNVMYSHAKVDWEPNRIVVGKGNDLAYCQGNYVWEIPDKDGKLKTYEGIYLTIWKKQPDGSWKYVWD